MDYHFTATSLLVRPAKSLVKKVVCQACTSLMETNTPNRLRSVGKRCKYVQAFLYVTGGLAVMCLEILFDYWKVTRIYFLIQLLALAYYMILNQKLDRSFEKEIVLKKGDEVRLSWLGALVCRQDALARFVTWQGIDFVIEMPYVWLVCCTMGCLILQKQDLDQGDKEKFMTYMREKGVHCGIYPQPSAPSPEIESSEEET